MCLRSFKESFHDGFVDGWPSPLGQRRVDRLGPDPRPRTPAPLRDRHYARDAVEGLPPSETLLQVRAESQPLPVGPVEQTDGDAAFIAVVDGPTPVAGRVPLFDAGVDRREPVYAAKRPDGGERLGRLRPVGRYRSRRMGRGFSGRRAVALGLVARRFPARLEIRMCRVVLWRVGRR